MSCSLTSSVTSKLLIHEQSEQLQTLKEILRATEQYRIAEAEGKLLRLPTGDGGALVFRTSPDALVLCALEISKALKSHPELRVRMGRATLTCSPSTRFPRHSANKILRRVRRHGHQVVATGRANLIAGQSRRQGSVNNKRQRLCEFESLKSAFQR